MLNLTDRARELLSRNKVDIQLIIEIDDIDFVFGVSPVKSLWKIGDANIRIGDTDLIVGGIVTNPKSKNLINAKDSTRSISQQLETDLGVSSVSSVNVSITDENEIATKLFSPSGDSDILGRGCTVYIAFTEGAHPEDSILVFDGVIETCTFNAGSAELNISHPEQLKRQAIFSKWESKILTDLASTVVGGEDAFTIPGTTIDIEDMQDLIVTPESQNFFTYFRINDEVFSFLNIDKGTSELNVLRQRTLFQSLKQSHEIGDTIESFYYLKGNPMDLALKLMCSRKSDESQYYIENLKVSEVTNNEPSEFPVTVRCEANDVLKANLQIDDEARLFPFGTGSHETENIYPERSFKIKMITFEGRYAFIHGDTTGFVSDDVNTYTISAISKWNVFPDGCGISNRYIDFEEYDKLRSLYASELTQAEIFIKDTIDDTKEFIDTVILRPQGLYTLPRKGRISVGKTTPPVANQETKYLSEKNVLNAKDIKIRRSINKGFYNAVIYKYTESPLEDKFLKGEVILDTSSFTRIKAGNRPLIIEAKSLRESVDATKVIKSQTKRILERFKYAVEIIPSIKVDFETGVNMDIGDTVVCQFKNLKVSDITSGSRDFQPRLMEVTNKTMSIARGEIELELTNTVFEVDGRYATISPSSPVASGSSTTLIRLKKSFSRKLFSNEKGKWDQYVGHEILVRSKDWTIQAQSTVIGIDATSDALIVSELPFIPGESYIVESPRYDDSNKNNMLFWKRLHAYLNPMVKVAAYISPTVIQVSSTDIDKFLPDAVLVIHDPDYDDISDEVFVKEVNPATYQITLSKSLSYTPSVNDHIELIGFKDGGLPYRLV